LEPQVGPIKNNNVWEFGDELVGGTDVDAVRSRYRYLALNSTLFMCWVIGFLDITTKIHAAMAAFIQRPSLTKLGLVPRDFLKTSIWTIADTIRLVSAFPDERILIRNEVEANAKKFLYRIRRVPEACSLWQWLFPDRMPQFTDRWNQDGLLFPRDGDYPELSVEAIGVGGASTSRHYTRIKEDDMIGKEAAKSPATMQVAKDDHALAMHLLVDPSVSRIDTYGTRWALHDLYQDMVEQETDLDIFHCGPTYPDGRPLWPERFSLPVLEKMRKKIGSYRYSLQILNESPKEGFNELSTADLNSYSRHTDHHGRRYFILNTPTGTKRAVYLHDLFIFQVLDPNISKTSQSSRSASVTVGLSRPFSRMDHFSIIILSAIAKATSPQGALELAHSEYVFWNPILFGIETVAAQEALKQWILSIYPDMFVKGLKPDHGAGKLARIRAFTPFGENGHIYIHPSMTQFIEEWESFPTGQYMDLLDACAYLPYIWTIPTFDTPSPNYRDPVNTLLGQDDEDLLVTEQNGGRNKLTGY
jgi:hypothetical protein